MSPRGEPVRRHASQEYVRHVVGVMTGTSIDGIDASLVRITGEGLAVRANPVRHVSAPLGDLQQPLRAAAAQTPMPAGEFARLAWEFGALHANVIATLLSQPTRGDIVGTGITQPDLICVHGQTIFHRPPVSWQLINIAPIAERFACPVVSDLRQADLARGGQGAPITPIADWVLFRDVEKKRAVVNLGGFCNMTILPSDRAGASSPPSATPGASLTDIRGFDVCACNQLLDAVARQVLGKPFDEDGRIASSGRADSQAAELLFGIGLDQAGARLSLGTGDELEAAAWISHQRARLSPPDLAATAVRGVADLIAHQLRNENVDEAILAGGGSRNIALVNAIAERFHQPVRLSDALGVPLESREAICMAILGALCQDGVAITLPQVTGCKSPSPVTGLRTNLESAVRSRPDFEPTTS